MYIYIYIYIYDIYNIFFPPLLVVKGREREREMGTKEEEKCGCNGGGRCKAVWFA
jgi:hypothetical protein